MPPHVARSLVAFIVVVAIVEFVVRACAGVAVVADDINGVDQPFHSLAAVAAAATAASWVVLIVAVENDSTAATRAPS